MKDDLTDRSQAVYVDGALSSYLAVNCGVPQGSILGPLCYILFTNDLPEVVMDTSTHVHGSSLNTNCGECGGLCCFADDSTYIVSSSDQENLKNEVTG